MSSKIVSFENTLGGNLKKAMENVRKLIFSCYYLLIYYYRIY